MAPKPGRVRAAVAVETCSPTGAHAAHQGGNFQCTTCHPCGGALGITTTTWPDGFVVSGTATKTASGDASCTVSCHGSQTVTWLGGPLGCSSCHGQWQGTAGVASAHGINPDVGLAGNSAVCTNCHNTSNHFDPSMTIVNANDGSQVLVSTATPAQVTVFCKACHDGSGKTFSGSGPPVLLGYDTIGSGDFHGARVGTGFGGTLKPPFAVGQPALDCIQCHEPHASPNPYLFASRVNGVDVPGGAVSTAGVGAIALCQGCHLGDLHAGCKASGCHDGVSVYNGATMSAEPVPANGPCLFCHGHQGIVNFQMPTWDNHPAASGSYCSHCHSSWYPWSVNTAKPAVTNLAASNVLQTSVDIVWNTNVPADSWVEYGVSDVTTVVGSPTLSTSHLVTLTGLTAGTTYKFRVRTTDALRNLTEAPAQMLSFTTSAPGSSEPQPTGLVAYNDPLWPNDISDVASPVALTLQWTKVTSPSGSTRYAVQVSSSSSYASLVVNLPSVTATTVGVSVPNPTWWPTLTTYYWRVKAIDAVTGTESAWSNGSFTTYMYDPYGY